MGNIESHPEDQRRKIYGGITDTPALGSQARQAQKAYVSSRPPRPSATASQSNYASAGKRAARSETVSCRVTSQTSPPDLFTVEARMDRYGAEEEKLRRAFEKLQRQREQDFKRELHDFESKHNPYEVLGIPNLTHDVDVVKKAYKRQALKHHPDKNGGDERRFTMITKSFAYIMKKIEKLQYKPAALPYEMKKEQDTFVQERSNAQNIHLDKNRFDKQKFNQIFDSHRLYDPDQEGYGDDMVNSSRLQEPENPIQKSLFTGAFNKHVFDSVFEQIKDEQQTTDIILYDEPEALLSSNLPYFEMGKGRVDDFGRSDTVSGSGYADYKKAHSSQATLIDPKKIQYKSFENIDDLQNHRSQISFELSDLDRKRQALKLQRQELEEEERLMRLQEHDDSIADMSKKINKLLLT